MARFGVNVDADRREAPFAAALSGFAAGSVFLYAAARLHGEKRMENALKNMDYAAFVDLAGTPRGAKTRLDNSAALSLCRSGWVDTKAPLVWLGVFWVAVIGLACTLIFGNWVYAPAWLLPVLVAARKSKQSGIAAVWRELKGQGKMPLEKRAEIYAFLVERDLLFLAPAPGDNAG